MSVVMRQVNNTCIIVKYRHILLSVFQIRNPKSKIKIEYFPFPHACRAIVPSYRRTVGPTSKFKHLPLHWHLRHYYIQQNSNAIAA